MKINYLSRKEQIILTTISLIHEIGINNISMKEIGRREGVTEASLYKHFKNKEDLISAVMEYYERYDSFVYHTLENNDEDAIENIVRYFTIYAEYYSNYKEITSLIHSYDVLAYDSNFTKRSSKLIEQKISFISELVHKGQEQKILIEEIQPENLANILLGSFKQIISLWRRRDYMFSLKEKEEETINNILKAFETNNRK